MERIDVEEEPIPQELAPEGADEPKKSSVVAIVGKVATFFNQFLAVTFLSIAVFFHAHRIEVAEKKSKLLGVSGELTRLEQERRQVADDLEKAVEAEKQRLENVKQTGAKDVQSLETEIESIRQRVEASKAEQSKFSQESAAAQARQKELLAQIETLREDRENTRSEEEALVLERRYLLDRLAKTTNELKQADARLREVQESISELQRLAGERAP